MGSVGGILFAFGFWLTLIVGIAVSLAIMLDIHDRWQQRVRRHDHGWDRDWTKDEEERGQAA